MIMQVLALVLEYIWNIYAQLHSPVNYRLMPRGKSRIVVRDVEWKSEMRRLIFVSQQLVYSRSSRLSKRKVRLYRVEVIEDSSNQEDVLSPSKIFIVPEMCSGVFKNTSVPHSCAINFVISKITRTA